MGIYDIPKDPGGLQFMMKVTQHPHCYYLILKWHSRLLFAPIISFISYVPIMCLFTSGIVPQSLLDFVTLALLKITRQLFCRLSLDFYLLFLHDSSYVLLEYHTSVKFQLDPLLMMTALTALLRYCLIGFSRSCYSFCYYKQ